MTQVPGRYPRPTAVSARDQDRAGLQAGGGGAGGSAGALAADQGIRAPATHRRRP